MRRIDIDRDNFSPWSHHIMRAFLLEVENAGQHRALGFIQFPVCMCMHHERPQLARRVRGNVVVYRGRHPDSAAYQVRDRVNNYYERRQEPRDQSHDRYSILARQFRVLTGDGPGYEFAQYYMKEHGQSEPGGSADHAQAHSGK